MVATDRDRPDRRLPPMRPTKLLVLTLLLWTTVADANRAPVVSNVHAVQRPGTMLVDIYYDVHDADGDEMTVSLQISDDGGQTWRVPAETFVEESDIGPGIVSGTGRHIVWDAGTDVPDVYNTGFRPRIVANDGQPPDGVRELTVDLPGGATMEFVWIEPGTFVMGTTEEQEQQLRDTGMWIDWFENERPPHEVALTQGFYLAKFEVTQEQWESVMATTPWSGRSNVQSHPTHPAVWILWEDAQEFLWRLNEASGEEMYRLPTAAEWEYACRAGTTTLSSFGDDAGRLGEYAWYRGNACDVGNCYAHAVGSKLPNPWGLHDMHGNVWEWCQDWAFRAYTSETQVDPNGPTSGSHHVMRGGAFYDMARYVRSAYRDHYAPEYLYATGLRVARGVLGQPIRDGFDDATVAAWIWESRRKGSGPTVAESHGRLEISLPEDSAGDPFSAGYKSVCRIRGDFDVQVDYQLLEWPSENGVRVGLAAAAPEAGRIGLVERISFGRSEFSGSPREAYLVHHGASVAGVVPTSDMSGTLRLLRSGSSVTGYYLSFGEWILLGSDSVPTDDATISLKAWSHDSVFGDLPVQMSFDNLVVNHGQVICR